MCVAYLGITQRLLDEQGVDRRARRYMAVGTLAVTEVIEFESLVARSTEIDIGFCALTRLRRSNEQWLVVENEHACARVSF